jgi:hypothetical protein
MQHMSGFAYLFFLMMTDHYMTQNIELWLYYPSICWTDNGIHKKCKVTGIWVNISTHDILNINEVPTNMLQHLVQGCDILL